MQQVISKFEESAQTIADSLRENERQIGAKFPRKFIRPLKDHYDRWPYLDPDRKRTVACVIQLCDINRWNLNVWDIGLTAGTVYEWHSSVPVIAVIETLIHEYGQQMAIFKKGTTFKGAINVLKKNEIIDKELCSRLHKLRKYRNELHLHLKDEVQMYDGKPRMYNESVLVLQTLEARLKAYWVALQGS